MRADRSVRIAESRSNLLIPTTPRVGFMLRTLTISVTTLPGYDCPNVRDSQTETGDAKDRRLLY